MASAPADPDGDRRVPPLRRAGPLAQPSRLRLPRAGRGGLPGVMTERLAAIGSLRCGLQRALGYLPRSLVAASMVPRPPVAWWPTAGDHPDRSQGSMTAAPSSPARGRPVSQIREVRRAVASFQRRRSLGHGSTGPPSTPGSGSPAQLVRRASPGPGARPRPPAAVPAPGSVQRPAAPVLRSSNRKRPGETGTAPSRQETEGSGKAPSRRVTGGATRKPAVGGVGRVVADRVERRAAGIAGLGRPVGFHKASPGAPLRSPARSGTAPSVEAPVLSRRPVDSATSVRAAGGSPGPVASSVPAHTASGRTFATHVGGFRTEPSTPIAGHRLPLSRTPPWGVASPLLTRSPIAPTPMLPPPSAPGRQLPTEPARLAAQSVPLRPGSAQTGARSPGAVTAAAASPRQGIGAPAWPLLRRATVPQRLPSPVRPAPALGDGTPAPSPFGGHDRRSIRPSTRYVVQRRAYLQGQHESSPPNQLSGSSPRTCSGPRADRATGGPSPAAGTIVPPRPKGGGRIWAQRRTGMARRADAVRRFHRPLPLPSSLQARSVGDGIVSRGSLAGRAPFARHGSPRAGEPGLATPVRPSPKSGFAPGAVAHGAPWHSASSSAKGLRQRPGASSPAVVAGAAARTASAGDGFRASPWSVLRRATVRPQLPPPVDHSSPLPDATPAPSPFAGHGRSSIGPSTPDLPQRRLHVRGDAKSSAPRQLADSLPRSSSGPAAPPPRDAPSSTNAAVVPPLRKGGGRTSQRRADIARRSDVARWSHRPVPLATGLRARSGAHGALPGYRPMRRRQVPLMPGGPFASVPARSAPGPLLPPIARAPAPTAPGARAWPRPGRAVTETAVPEGKKLPDRQVRRSQASRRPGPAQSPWSSERGQRLRSVRAPSPLASSRWAEYAGVPHQPSGSTARANRSSISEPPAPARGELRARRSAVPASGNQSAHRPAGRARQSPHPHRPGPQSNGLPAPGPLPARTPPPSGVAGLPVGGAMALAGRLQRAAVATAVPPVVGSSEPGTAAASSPAVAAHRGGAKTTVGVPSVQRRSGRTFDDRASVPPLPPVPGPARPGPATAATTRGGGQETQDRHGLDHLVDRVVEALEDRVLGELERRGGRFLGAF